MHTPIDFPRRTRVISMEKHGHGFKKRRATNVPDNKKEAGMYHHHNHSAILGSDQYTGYNEKWQEN